MINLGWILIAVIAIAVLAWMGRYEVIPTQYGIMYKLDRFTGKVDEFYLGAQYVGTLPPYGVVPDSDLPHGK